MTNDGPGAAEAARRSRPMNYNEKILCHNALGLEKPEVSPGQMICVKVCITGSGVDWFSAVRRSFAIVFKLVLWLLYAFNMR
jgi:hypothetical protein